MTTTTASGPPTDEDDLVRMSFGDHLEELRMRLMRSLIAVGVCMMALLPFKKEVTSIYTGPYRQMWHQSYAAFVDGKRAELGALRAAKEADPAVEIPEQLVETVEWHDKYGPKIRDGSYDFEDYSGDIESFGRFKLKYTLAALGGISDFWVFMAASILFGLLIASPVVLYQGWMFVAGGLYRHERRVVHRYFPLAAGLLLTGILFGYFVVVPYGLYFLVKLMNFGQVVPIISVTQYFSMLLTLTGALGVCFQLPLVMLALVKVGIVTHGAMKRNWRYVILGCFVLSAILTPPDPFTQSMMAGPMVVLYLFGLLLTASATRETPDADVPATTA